MRPLISGADSTSRDRSGHIIQAAQRAQRLVRELLTMTKPRPPTFEAVDLNALIKHRTDGVYFGSAALVYGISENRFKRLSPAAQAAMIKAGDDITMQACKAIDKNVAEALERMKRGGMEITPIPAPEKARLATVFDKVAKDWIDDLDKRGKPAARVAADFRAALKN